VNLSNGEPLIKGKKVTGFSWPEEIIEKRDDAVPFNLEEEMKKIGADYSKADKPWGVHVIEDGRLITGQNPSSARGVAEAVIKRLKTRLPLYNNALREKCNSCRTAIMVSVRVITKYSIAQSISRQKYSIYFWWSLTIYPFSTFRCALLSLSSLPF
jgi:hypothetical protein